MMIFVFFWAGGGTGGATVNILFYVSFKEPVLMHTSRADFNTDCLLEQK